MMRKIMVILLFVGEWISLFVAIRHFRFCKYFGFINKLFPNLMITPDKEMHFRTSRKIFLLVRWTSSFIFWIRTLVMYDGLMVLYVSDNLEGHEALLEGLKNLVRPMVRCMFVGEKINLGQEKITCWLYIFHGKKWMEMKHKVLYFFVPNF